MKKFWLFYHLFYFLIFCKVEKKLKQKIKTILYSTPPLTKRINCFQSSEKTLISIV